MPAPPPAPPPAAISAAPVAPPPAAPAAAPSAGGSQTASLPPPAAAGDGRITRIEFGKEAAELPATARQSLAAAINELKRDDKARLQLIAYANGGDDSGSQARRLSLSRALAVRAYLIDHGVHATRMDVRAMGNKVPDGPPDRVDVVMVRR
ncbi:MAG: OmpA family protein [Rhodospirillales bacterium]|nr:OmpA family protein [Rhodospirillales bacterium]